MKQLQMLQVTIAFVITVSFHVVCVFIYHMQLFQVVVALRLAATIVLAISVAEQLNVYHFLLTHSCSKKQFISGLGRKSLGKNETKQKMKTTTATVTEQQKSSSLIRSREKSSFKSLEFLLGPNFRRPETISLLCFRQIIFNQFYQKQFGNEAIDHYITKCDQIVAQCLRNYQRP